MSGFCFYNKKVEVQIKSKDKSVIIESGINKKNDLFKKYALELSFPSYFGNNWDALYDCLCDLSWIQQLNVVIVHEDLPLANSADCTQYINLLLDVLEVFGSDKTRQLKIWFSENLKKDIEILIAKARA